MYKLIIEDFCKVLETHLLQLAYAQLERLQLFHFCQLMVLLQ